jgi:hypothetical protein
MPEVNGEFLSKPINKKQILTGSALGMAAIGGGILLTGGLNSTKTLREANKKDAEALHDISLMNGIMRYTYPDTYIYHKDILSSPTSIRSQARKEAYRSEHPWQAMIPFRGRGQAGQNILNKFLKKRLESQNKNHIAVVNTN